MSTCPCCGASLTDNTSAWGEGACGQCIAARIELTLMRLNGLLGVRKPARRSALGYEELEAMLLAPERKSG